MIAARHFLAKVNESHLLAVCLSSIALGIFAFFLLTPGASAVFLEYFLKFLPPLSDRGLPTILDGYLLGDPRGRLVANLFGYINITVRQYLLQSMAIPPTLSVSWLLYPATLVTFGLAVSKMTGSRRAAAMAVVVLAASPALLDFFVDYFIPAKPLVVFFFCSALLAAASITRPQIDGARKWTALAAIAVSLLCGLMSDETGIFIAICIPIMFAPWFLSPASHNRLAFVMAFAFGACAFAAILLIAIPAVNRALAQVPLDFPQLLSKGAYQTMFGTEPARLQDLIARDYSPKELLQTILSAHFFPWRRVFGLWTTLEYGRWNGPENLYAFVACAAWVRLVSWVPVGTLIITCWVFVAFLAFVLFQAVVILRLAPFITEVNYYANLSSVFVGLLVAVPLAAWVNLQPDRPRVIVGWAIVALIATIEFTNYVETTKRHPMFRDDPAPVSWQALSEGYRQAREGTFADWAKAHPYPSRLFVWVLEAAIAESRAKGRNVDLQPFNPTQDTPLALIDFDRVSDPKVPAIPVAPMHTEEELQRVGAVPIAVSKVLDFGSGDREFRGRVGSWQFRWRKTDDGVQQLVWHDGLMRLWSEQGTITSRNTCPRFVSYNIPCPRLFYSYGNQLLGVNATGIVQVVLATERSP